MTRELAVDDLKNGRSPNGNKNDRLAFNRSHSKNSCSVFFIFCVFSCEWWVRVYTIQCTHMGRSTCSLFHLTCIWHTSQVWHHDPFKGSAHVHLNHAHMCLYINCVHSWRVHSEVGMYGKCVICAWESQTVLTPYPISKWLTFFNMCELMRCSLGCA